jgi:hypothetical protein
MWMHVVYSDRFWDFSIVTVQIFQKILTWKLSAYPIYCSDFGTISFKYDHFALQWRQNICLYFWSRFELTTSVVISTDCIGSCKSNYHTITATTVPYGSWIYSYLCNHCFKADATYIGDMLRCAKFVCFSWTVRKFDAVLTI